MPDALASLHRKARRGLDLYGSHGLEPFRHRLEARRYRGRHRSLIQAAVSPEDVIGGLKRPYRAPTDGLAGERARVAWVFPAVSPRAGGMVDAVEIMLELERRGHSNSVFISDRANSQSLGEHGDALRGMSEELRATVAGYAADLGDEDVAIATSWESVYPLLRYRKQQRLLYLVQDYEPYFAGRGGLYELAALTYEQGLEGITLGPWVAKQISSLHGMRATPFPLALSHSQYSVTNEGEKNGVFFYARPETPRRGFELGCMALQVFHERNPATPIHLLGGSGFETGYTFPFTAHGFLDAAGLNALYNECSAGLVLSYTNASLLPNEMLAAGCVPVSNVGKNVSMVVDNDHIVYSSSSPLDLAAALERAIELNRGGYSQVLAQSVASRTWAAACDVIEPVICGRGPAASPPVASGPRA